MSEKSRWQAFKERNGGVTPFDMINPNMARADEDKAVSRFATCQECPSLIKLTNQCKECGCFMKLKVKLEGATCPLGKW